VASISTFETREHADEANRLAQEAVQRVFKDLLPNPPTVIMGEVVSHSGKYSRNGDRIVLSQEVLPRALEDGLQPPEAAQPVLSAIAPASVV
jgi:hypothetical protein